MLFSSFFNTHGKKYIIGIILLMIINVCFLQMPKLLGLAVDSLNQQKEGLTIYIWSILLVGIVITIMKFLSRRYLLGSIRYLEFEIRRRLLNHALAIPISYYEKNGPGKVMALMTNDVTSIRVALGLGIMIVVDVLFFAIISFFIVAKETSATIALSLLFPMPFILSLSVYFGKRMRKTQREAQGTFSDITEFSQELFLGMPVLRAFNKELTSYERFIEVNRKNFHKNMRVALLDSIVGPVTHVLPFVCFGLNIYYTGNLILAGEISIGEFVALNGYLMLLIGPLMGLGALVAVLQKGAASLDRICEFLEEPIEKEEPSSDMLPLDTITIKNLSFVYPETERAVLNNISLTIPKGAFIGFVGGPGSGKSTLFKLLLRLYEGPKKCIFFGKEDASSIALETLRRSIAYVSPTAYILGATIRENISFGEASSRNLTVEEAAKRAALTEDLGLKVRTETQKVKEGGADLSGGQKQRINMARGFFKNAPYLLLDDSLSALDFMSAAQVLAHLRTEREQTILFISQRIEALKDADCIYVFKDGYIAESGHHEELLAKKGEYYRLYAQQLEGGEGHD